MSAVFAIPGAMDATWIRRELARTNRTQVDLARVLGRTPSQVTRLLQGKRALKVDEAERIKAYFEGRLTDLQSGRATLPRNAPQEPPLPSPPIETALPDAFKVEFGKRDLPVYGAAECGPDGVVNFPQDPIEWFWRPPELAGVRDAFAMYAAGDSMSDASVPAGTMVWVQKHRAPAVGRLCLVLKTGEGAFIKQYRGRKGGKVLLYQSNPPKVIEWPESEVQAIYRIVGTWEG